MIHNVSQDLVPDELADAVRSAAAAVPPGVHAFSVVERRRRAYQRRRKLTTVGLAAMLVGATAAAVPLAVRVTASDPAARTDPAVAGASTVPTTASPPVQRMMLVHAHDQRQQIGERVVSIDAPDGIVELRADGSLAGYPRTNVMDGENATVALPDGRLVQLGSKDLRPGVSREDGPWVTDVHFVLAIVAPDGSAQLARNVRIMGEGVELVGATERAAYLLRDRGRIVSHDLASGAEQPMSSATAAFGEFRRDVGAEAFPTQHRLSVQDGRLVMFTQIKARGSAGARLRVANLATGAQILDLSVPEAVAQGINDVRLSPDGRFAAMYAGRFTENPSAPDWRSRLRVEHRFVIVEVATGRIVENRLLVEQFGDQLAAIAGVAWTGNSTVRAAWYAVPSGASGTFPLADILRVETVTV